MINEFKKSVNSILTERITSPFWGAFISGWIAWNWQLIYITLFVSENKLALNKFEYILSKYPINIYNTLLIPFLISFGVLGIIPIISNGAFWLSLKYKVWKINKKREIEKPVLLTFKESVELKEEIQSQEEKFYKLNIEKDKRIVDLNEQVNKLQGMLDENRASNNQKDKTINTLNDRISIEINNKNDFSNVFSGEWAYELNNVNKHEFNLYNRNEVDINNITYEMKTIDRYKNKSFRLIMVPRNIDIEAEDYYIRYLTLNRSKNMDDFEGIEWAIIRKGDKFSAEKNKLVLRKY